MANTKKTKPVEEEVEVEVEASETVKTKAVKNDPEKEALKEQLAQQQKQMEDLMAQMQLLMRSQAQSNLTTDNVAKTKRNIKFVSLAPGITVLKGNKTHIFEGQFKTKSIPETEAYAIINNMERAIENGLIYIADAKFVEECELDGIYADILDDKQLKSILSSDSSTVCELYKNANNTQRGIILGMIQEQIFNGTNVDANILVELGELTGQDLLALEPLDDKT